MRFCVAIVFLALSLFLSLRASAAKSEARRACSLLRTSFYSDAEKEDIQSWCALPARTRNLLAPQYWFRHAEYQIYLRRFPVVPQAKASADLDDKKVSEILDRSHACQFYSMISPSVQSGRVSGSRRLRIVMDADDMLDQCDQIGSLIASGLEEPCSVIELAGHSTQAVGLDTVLGSEYPSKTLIKTIGECLRNISNEGVELVTSTCGAERDSEGFLHYWPGKDQEQQKLSNILKMPIISGVGPVSFASRFGPNGVEAVGGWTISYPRSRVSSIDRNLIARDLVFSQRPKSE